MQTPLLLITLLSLTALAARAEIHIQSPAQPPVLLELFTSEGCSSCPPAEAWLEHWKTQPELWQSVVPLAFHVDYWDNLGWPDRFARASYSERQQHYAQRWQNPGGVYTPGFVANGLEWRGTSTLPQTQATQVQIKATGSPQHLAVQVTGADALALHVAWLGFDLRSKIASGENSGRTLTHDFVVLDHSQQTLSKTGSPVTLDQPNLSDKPGAVALWVTDSTDRIVQAAGGWLR